MSGFICVGQKLIPVEVWAIPKHTASRTTDLVPLDSKEAVLIMSHFQLLISLASPSLREDSWDVVLSLQVCLVLPDVHQGFMTLQL
jgi:hypothetical protein